MLALLLTQAAVPAAPPATPPSPAPTRDIEVIGRHLSRLRLSIDLDGPRLKACRITVSSGDAIIDAAACPAVQACLAEAPRTGSALLACTDRRIADVVTQHDGEPADER